MSKTCKNCGTVADSDAKFCPNCGEVFPDHLSVTDKIITVVVLIVLGIVVLYFSSDETQKNNAAANVTEYNHICMVNNNDGSYKIYKGIKRGVLACAMYDVQYQKIMSAPFDTTDRARGTYYIVTILKSNN